MDLIPATFQFSVGLKTPLFHSVQLVLSWERPQDLLALPFIPMEMGLGEDGCPYFEATVQLDEQRAGQKLYWSVLGYGPAGSLEPLVTLEAGEPSSWDDWNHLYRCLVFEGRPTREVYRFCLARWLGANARRPSSESDQRKIEFSVWAPFAQRVELVRAKVWDWTNPEKNLFAHPSVWERVCGGYVGDQGEGMEEEAIPMTRDPKGVWSYRDDSYERWRARAYLFRILREDGSLVYRTDLYSRSQIGEGYLNPRGRKYQGPVEALEGSVSASLVVDPESVIDPSHPTCLWPEPQETFVPEEAFWMEEFSTEFPLPSRIEDLIIYEVHLGALGFGREGAGTFEDAIQFLDHLSELGVNAVELLPLCEFGDGPENWGYSTSHYFALEYGSQGRDQFKQFVRACHRRGMVVLFDVVFNHYLPDAERAEWKYDSERDEHNLYYWYEPGLGYLDNGSSGYAPRYCEEMVRHMFLSSALVLVEEFHVDGFRVDLTNAIHRDNVAHNTPVPRANLFGCRFLRELTRTLRTVRPNLLLIAEDHSGWAAVTDREGPAGLGFDAAWYAEFYHSLVGDAPRGPEVARLLWVAGQGGDGPLNLQQFGSILSSTSSRTVVYHKNHDEAGNDPGTARTLVTAAGGAEYLTNPTARWYAEARARWVAGISILSAGIPLFLFGEEVGAKEPFLYGQVLPHREDLIGKRSGEGAGLFTFYRDLIHLRRSHEVVRRGQIEVFYTHNVDRVLAFRRWIESTELLVVGSLANSPYTHGYRVSSPRLSSGSWREIFNSDAAAYGGHNVANGKTLLSSAGGEMTLLLPACGFVVLQRSEG